MITCFSIYICNAALWTLPLIQQCGRARCKRLKAVATFMISLRTRRLCNNCEPCWAFTWTRLRSLQTSESGRFCGRLDVYKMGEIQSDRTNVCSDNNTYVPQGIAPHQLFVGDLPSHLTEDGLREQFSLFGSVLDCRVIRDPLTHKSKCFGFVRFAKNEEAETAISQSSSMCIDGRKVRTNWAVKRDPDYPLSLEQVLIQASPYNTTIYIGGLGRNFNGEFVRGMCAMYGPLMELRLFQDKGYAFVRYASRESAAAAILGINNSEIHGYHVRCSWGKEMRDPFIMKMARSMPTMVDTGYAPCAQNSGPSLFPSAPPACGWPYLAPLHHPTQIATNIGNYHISFPYAAPPFYQTIQF